MGSRRDTPSTHGKISRRNVLAGAAALGTVGYGLRSQAGGQRHAATDFPPETQADTPMEFYIGAATSRVDGPAKVTGDAKYAAEFNMPGLLHGRVVTSSIARGRIVRIDDSEARKVSGVVEVLTHENRPPMAGADEAYKDTTAPKEGSPFRPLYGDKIMFSQQPVALVVAEDPDVARFAASLVRVEYDEEPHITDLYRKRDATVPVTSGKGTGPPKPRGSPEEALASAEVRHAAEYFVPIEHHNPMELYATTAVWEGDGKLTAYVKTQGVQNVRDYLSRVFEMKPEDVRVMSAFMGGGFGSGLRPQYEVVLAVLAARALERSVRVVLTRQQMFVVGYRPAMIQRIEIGANKTGNLDAITHDAITVTSQYEKFFRQETGWSGLLYKCDNAKYVHRLAQLDLPTSCDMRAPSAATGVYALECAMDELAVSLNIDPLELRLRSYSDRDQNQGLPYSSKNLHACYEQGAEAFGWSKRKPEPRSMREGTELVGWGMATGVWEALQMPTAARITLGANGHAEVACATSDIGTGTYTIMAQAAAEMLGLPIEQVSIKLGDSTLPKSPVEGGSWMAASVTAAISSTADAVRKELLRFAQAMPDSPLAGGSLEQTKLAGGRIVSTQDASRSVSIADAMRHGSVDSITQETTAKPQHDGKHAHNTHSAIFAEVKVDEQLGIIRVTRIVNAVAGGRILNAKTARSQIMGGVVWGIGMALHEETLVDHEFGRFMNHNIAEYHVPVNADVYDIEVIFVDEPDTIINPLGVKGLGEIGIVGVPAAIANAVYHATGKRVRDLPITLDKVMA